MKLNKKLYVQTDGSSILAHYRPGTSDEGVLKEVVDNAIYRRKRSGFDVMPGERWLDLGANIGAFAIYCRVRGATAECYEPVKTCFDILKLNAPKFKLYNFAVTNRTEKLLPARRGRGPNDHYRATLAAGNSALPVHEEGSLPNKHGAFLKKQRFDGVKMDIEGSEAGLLDDELLPRCEKLCMEYHLSRDSSTSNLKRRLKYLQSLFETVQYPPEFDRLIAAGGNAKTFFDRMIYCWGRR